MVLSLEHSNSDNQKNIDIGSNNMHDICEHIIRIILKEKNILEILKANFNNNNITSKKEIEQILNGVLPFVEKKFQIVIKKRNRKQIPENEMCMGRKLDYKQCTRRRMGDSEYCRSHMRKLPNGRIDEEVVQNRVKAKRGRKRKVEFDNRLTDPNYVTLWEDIINGERMLVDMSGNVYTFDTENPKYLGKKSLDGKIE